MKNIAFLLFLLMCGAHGYAQSYTTFKNKDSLMGLKDPQGKIIVAAAYDYVCPFFTGDLSYVRLADKYGLIDRSGKLLTALRYNEVNLESDGIAYVNIGGQWDELEDAVIGGKWGLVNASGKELTPVKYDELGAFSKDGFTLALLDNKLGVLSKGGKETTPFKYDYIRLSNTTPGIAMVNIGGKYDEVFGDPKFNETIGGQQGFINYVTGRELGNLAYADVMDFSEGLAAVAIQQDKTGAAQWRYGYINTSGTLVIPAIYEEATAFWGGIAKVKLAGKDIRIDKTGKTIK